MEIIKKYGKPIDPDRLKGGSKGAVLGQRETLRTAARMLLTDDAPRADCWVCGNKEGEAITNVYGVSFLNCPECNHVFQEFIIPEDKVYEFFASDEDVNCHLPEEQFLYRAEHVSRPKIAQVRELRELLGLSVSSGRWLDLGCGAGELLWAVKKELGWEIEGFDLSQPGIDSAKGHGIEATLGDIFSFAESSRARNGFDVISAIGYFDMVSRPKVHMELAHSLLRTDGMIVVDLPNFESLTVDVIRSIPDEAIRYCNALQRSIFTEKSLRRLLTDCGFELVFQWKFGLDFYTFASSFLAREDCTDKDNACTERLATFLFSHFDKFQSIIDESGYNDTHFWIARKS